MTSISPVRRVLSTLDANTPLTRPGAPSLKTSKTSSPTRPVQMAETLPQASLSKTPKCGPLDEAVSGLRAKRKSYSEEDSTSYGSTKRHRGTTAGTEEDAGADIQAKLLSNNVQGICQEPQSSSQAEIVGHSYALTTAPSSPASSLTSQQDSELNDSQNTTITIPEDSPLPPRHSPLTRDQLRQKAREVKLRLSLASYKVRTNQIDVPISRLEIRSSTTSSRIPPVPRTTTLSSQIQHSSRISTAIQIQDLGLQGPIAEKKKPQSVTVPSSPPSYNAAMEDKERLDSPTKLHNEQTRDCFATPLLPRQRQGISHPPSLGGSASLGDRGSDLPSSVVKGRAADGLLSLMRQHE